MFTIEQLAIDELVTSSQLTLAVSDRYLLLSELILTH